MKSVVPRDLPSLFLVCMAIMASRFSTDGRNQTHVLSAISFHILQLMQRTESSSLRKMNTHTHMAFVVTDWQL